VAGMPSFKCIKAFDYYRDSKRGEEEEEEEEGKGKHRRIRCSITAGSII